MKDGKIISLSIEDLNNKIYATTDNNNVYELDSSFSQVKNKYELNASVYSSLIVDKKTICWNDYKFMRIRYWIIFIYI